MSCGVGRRCSLDLALLWLWCRPAAAAPIWPLAWEPLYVAGVVLKGRKKKTTSNYNYNGISHSFYYLIIPYLVLNYFRDLLVSLLKFQVPVWLNQTTHCIFFFLASNCVEYCKTQNVFNSCVCFPHRFLV